MEKYDKNQNKYWNRFIIIYSFYKKINDSKIIIISHRIKIIEQTTYKSLITNFITHCNFPIYFYIIRIILFHNPIPSLTWYHTYALFFFEKTSTFLSFRFTKASPIIIKKRIFLHFSSCRSMSKNKEKEKW